MERRLVSYLGTFRHSLDARNRVTVPSAWRVTGDDENYYMAWPHPEGCIAFFTPEMQEELHQKIAAIPQSDVRGQRLLRQTFGRSAMCGCDKQGRMVIPESLLKHAGVGKDAVLVGLGRNFQMWSGERFDEPDGDILEDMKALGI